MKFKNPLDSRLTSVAAGAVVLAVLGAGSALAAAQVGSDGIQDNSVTSKDIKDGTIQKQDLTANNFRKFTETSTVITAITPASTNPAYAGAPVVDVAASPRNGTADARIPLLSVQLDKGTYVVDATAQFLHLTGSAPDVGYGVLSLSLAGSGYANAVSADIPDNGNNPAQTSLTKVVTIGSDNTNLTVLGAIRGERSGQAGASVTITKVGFKL
ncbi:MAG: hypothetical protein WKF79_04165 [Nocardioides sp.]